MKDAPASESEAHGQLTVSVIICTYNRAKALEKTLSSFHALRPPPDVVWELLIVNNNSTDDTARVCAEAARALPIRSIEEARQGKSHALNTGIAEARGELLLFTDDDVDVDASWLDEYVKAARNNPEVNFFGGRICVAWEAEPPAWLKDNAEMLSGITIYYDRARLPSPVTSREKPFYGANIAFRKSVFARGVRFRTEFGIVGKNRIGGEEQMLIYDLLENGCKGLYVPSAVIHHRCAKSRMSESYLRHWYASFGKLEVKCNEIPLAANQWFKVPRYLWKQLILNAMMYLFTRPFAKSKRWLSHEIKAAMAWGAILELRGAG
jgi:glycosyltransferase involved in cell wall biosynthesis